MTDLPRLIAADQPLVLSSLARGALPLVLSDLARAARGTGNAARAVFVAPDEQAMQAIADAAPFFAPELDVIEFPAWDCLPYDRSSPALSVSARRLAALQALNNRGQGKADGPQLLVTTVNALLQRVLTPFRIREATRMLKPGAEIGHESLIALLQRQGYARSDTAIDAGEFAVRGSIFDIVPSGLKTQNDAGETIQAGLRLDFFGDELESMRLYDPTTQRTTGVAEQHLLLPASEALLSEDTIKRFRGNYREMFGANATGDPLYQAVSEGRRLAGMEHWLPLFEEKLSTLFDHLGKDDTIVIDGGAIRAGEERLAEIRDYRQARQQVAGQKAGSYRPLATDALYLSEDEFNAALASWPVHRCSIFAEPESDRTLDFGFASARDFAPERSRSENIYDAASKHLEKQAKADKRVVLACYSTGSRGRIVSQLGEAGKREPALADSWQEALGIAAKGRPVAVVLPLESGFASEQIELLTERDLLGDRLVRRKKRRKDADAFLAELQALSPGDLIVHMDHGIGRYLGLQSVPVGKSPHDCVALEYHGGDKLYVPVENLDVLSRYGSENENAALDRLGGEAWQKRKSRLKERIREIAHELLATAAKRALQKAPVIEPDADYNAFVDRFPWDETDDQDRAIGDVMGDLADGRAMDRLVCGDVGFGKTEVALRAAFLAAMAGQQVVMIAPTTLLARQHYANFTERFAGFPIKIGRLSRLVPAKEAAETRDGLEAGTVDIVVGTHAILSKSVRFKRLGLVIVDEEQRFGVTHKEKLKALRANVHVLTLTATPIPRTLNMALGGLRELSLITTPPPARIAIKTQVTEWDGPVIREAVMRELRRGGQVYFVHNEVQSIEKIAEDLRQLLPEASLRVGHGQMRERDLEQLMVDFHHRRFDILLCTTIIESGIDVPSANTILINRADRLGLAQLHQLRGRVGRSNHRAYAYLLVPSRRGLTPDAARRLEAIESMEELGAGFVLATHDLEIRGAGEFLGESQSGELTQIGLSLYLEMLERAVTALKEGRELDLDKPLAAATEVNLHLPALLPADYVNDVHTRLTLYKRIAATVDAAGLEDLQAELVDRFGPLPAPATVLLRVARLTQLARAAGIRRFDVGAQSSYVVFEPDHKIDPAHLIQLIQKEPRIYRLEGSLKLRIGLGAADADRPDLALGLLQRLLRPAAPVAAPAPRRR